MKTRTWIAFLIVIALTTGLWALIPQATTAVQADESSRAARQGAWLDAVVFTEQASSEDGVSQLQADELDLYAYSITEPSLWQTMLEDPALEHTEAHGTYNELTFNPSGPTFNDGRLNPFSEPAIREAMNRLVDRNHIAQVICGGMTTPRWLPIQTIGADYARYKATAEALVAEYAYDPGGAEAAIDAEMLNLGATLVDGKWYYGGEPVVIIALIRVEDERLEIGDYVADQLEAIGFTVDRQYKTSAEAGQCWISSDPADGCFHYYTGGWVSTVISRDDSNNFGDYYTPLGWGIPLWQAYTPSPEFYEVARKLYSNDFSTLAERDDLFELALDLAMEDSVRIYLKEDIGATPRRAGTAIASDLAGSVYAAEMWPYVARFDGVEGGTMRAALASFLNSPWNPVAGSSWVYDKMPINATMDRAFIRDPNDGLVWPQRAASAEVVVLDGTPVGKTHNWVTLSFAPQIDVPADAWVGWDVTEQRFITRAEKYPTGLAAVVKSTVTYPADLFTTVTWHDGSPLDLADFVMRMILTFDRGNPDSPIYDASAAAELRSLLMRFRGVAIESSDPLVITTYEDLPSFLFFDDFSDPSSGWFVGDQDNATFSYQEGEYEIALSDAYSTGETGAPTDPVSGNFSIEADMRLLTGPNIKYGLSWGGLWGMYHFRIDPGTQEYLLVLCTEGCDVVADGTSVSIHPGSESNHLELKGSDDTLELYVNGQFLASAPNQAPDDGLAGVEAWSLEDAATARFDNFRTRTVASTRLQIDAELMAQGWWPNYAHGPGAWHNLAAAIRAEEAEALAFSESKADSLGVPWTDFVAGSSLGILEGWMDLSAIEDYIPYEPTLGAYVTPTEAGARWANLQTWHDTRGHFWLGTGPFSLDSADPDAGTLTLLHNPAFPDVAGRWDAYAADPAPELEINYTSGAPGSYFNVTGSGFPPDSTASIVANDHLLGQVPVDGSGEIAFTLTTEEAGEGTYHLRVTVNPSGGLAFVLDKEEPEYPKEGELEEIDVPEGLVTYQVYLPIIVRGYP